MFEGLPAKEIREWVQLLFVAIGGTIAITAFLQNQRQRRIENSLKLVSLFKDALRENDIHEWQKLLVATCEPSGAPRGYFRNDNGDLLPLDTMFSEGSEDDDAIQRIAENLEIICHQINTNTVDVKFVYFELGQLLTTMHDWLSATKGYSASTSLLDDAFPNIKKTHKKYAGSFKKWPFRHFGYIE